MNDQKHFKDTMEKAKVARNLYRQGLTADEIAQSMAKSVPTVWRYFQLTGKLTREDRAYHEANRYLKHDKKILEKMEEKEG